MSMDGAITQSLHNLHPNCWFLCFILQNAGIQDTGPALIHNCLMQDLVVCVFSCCIVQKFGVCVEANLSKSKLQ